MEHLLKAIEKLAKLSGHSLSSIFLGDVYKYVRTGDNKLLPGLLGLDEARMNSLCAVAKAMARPDHWAEGDLRLIEFFVRRCALFNGRNKGHPQGDTLGHVLFVKHRSVELGSYTYDEPAGEKDSRVVAFGAVPAIAFSEAMGDLERISGKSQSKPAESADA